MALPEHPELSELPADEHYGVDQSKANKGLFDCGFFAFFFFTFSFLFPFVKEMIKLILKTETNI